MQYKDNSFVTLTYDDEHISDDWGLVPRHLVLFIKRLRINVERNYGRKFRYFAVGEYGSKTMRPHYHLALFNFPPCQSGETRYTKTGTVRCCEWCNIISTTWNMGRSNNLPFYPEAGGYISGYVTKKWTSPDHPSLAGKYPEFTRMSKNPGIGAGALDDVASQLLTYGLETMSDVPSTLRFGGKLMPIGRYLRNHLRLLVGKPKGASPTTIQEQANELRAMREAAWKDQIPLKEFIITQNQQARITLEQREKRFSKREKL